MPVLVQKLMPSPLGALRLVATDAALVGVYLPAQAGVPAEDVASHPVLDQTARELDEYFRGERRAFTTPLAPHGTPFQLAVWQALAAIPFGEVRSYAALAQAVGRPRAVRAVGAANGRNPLSIIVPCHRVVAAAGALTGYAGGLPAKEWLLAHERRAATRLHPEA
ncbi:MAG TPA: methylated-DNA--[protein]-cysteine S-methyltransferase [Polyangia bacterium]